MAKGLPALIIKLYLQRGGTYTFNMSTAGHPFFINTIQGTGTANAYASEVTNNGLSGRITFTVPMDAPGTLLQLSVSWFYERNNYDYKLIGYY
jgi:hypothetical protein